MSKVKPADLEKIVSGILEEYAGNIEKGTRAAAKKVAEVAKNETKKGSPVLKGSYKKGWAVKETIRRLGTGEIVHNRTDYQLAHLLEKGHAKRGGGRTAAIPHIKPAEERAVKGFEEAVRKLAQGQGS